jgi:hypothetical protein
MKKMTRREIICCDALDFLAAKRFESVFASPPDADEIGATPKEWASWFIGALSACIRASRGPVVFSVTDRKVGGVLISKAGMVMRAAAETGATLVGHKICLRRGVGKVDLHRPGYTHLLFFNGRPGAATPDVIERGQVVYPNGIGVAAARAGLLWIKGQGASAVADPFCGRGTIPALANALGMDAVGVDIDPAQCEFAKKLKIRLA